jgi:hypothetical protein
MTDELRQILAGFPMSGTAVAEPRAGLNPEYS